MLNQNQENMYNALLRRVEPQREPITVNVNNPPKVEPINVTPKIEPPKQKPSILNRINSAIKKSVEHGPILQEEKESPRLIVDDQGNPLLKSIKKQTEYKPNALLNSMETQTEYQPNELLNNMETQTEMPILSYGNVYQEQSSKLIIQITNKYFFLIFQVM